MDRRVFTYHVDADGVLVAVNAHWKAFAGENDAPRLADTAVGTRLEAHIYGEEVRELYRLIYSDVRQHRRSVEIPFRCDSPGVRRALTLTIRPAEDDGLTFASRIVQEESRAPVRLIDPQAPRSDQFLTMCAWCKRVRSGAAWLDLEAAAWSMGLFEADELPMISHSICPQCEDSAMALLERR